MTVLPKFIRLQGPSSQHCRVKLLHILVFHRTYFGEFRLIGWPKLRENLERSSFLEERQRKELRMCWADHGKMEIVPPNWVSWEMGRWPKADL